jgi:hypothetical protein
VNTFELRKMPSNNNVASTKDVVVDGFSNIFIICCSFYGKKVVDVVGWLNSEDKRGGCGGISPIRPRGLH